MSSTFPGPVGFFKPTAGRSRFLKLLLGTTPTKVQRYDKYRL
jgi:hypothetical protein